MRPQILSITKLFIIMSIVSTGVIFSQSDTTRIVCVGNSITEGWMTTNPVTDNYTAQLGVLLGNGWLVKNAGVSGRTMLKSGDYPIWNEQKFKDGLAFNPDIVTICLGTNDSKPYNWDDKKSNFIPDYYAMIDTFRSLPSNPVVWLCIPPPVFKDVFDIRDSVMVAEVMPMIRDIAAAKSCPIIDFYSLMIDHSDMIPDGVHPNTIGSARMAESLYGTLTGNTVTRVTEENAAIGKNISVSGSINSQQYGGSNLIDGDNTSQWIALGFPSEAVIDLGSDQIIDFFRIDFGTASDAITGYQFRIETAGSAGGYSTAIDLTTRTDSAAIILQKTDSITARFVRLTVTGASRPRGDTVGIAEFRILKANGSIHTPALTSRKIGSSTSNQRYEVKFQWPKGSQGKMMLYRYSNTAGLSSATGFINGNSYALSYEYVKSGNYNKYYAVTFCNGVETVSDTLIIGTLPTGVEENKSAAIPSELRLLPCYPNPFNPTTNITFTITSRSFVTIKIVDLFGREVSIISSGEMEAGTYTHQWNASVYSSGIYYCRIQAGNFIGTEKLVLLK